MITTYMPETEYKDKIELKGNANENQNSSITINNLSSNDTAVYYCAASLHSAADALSSLQIPL